MSIKSIYLALHECNFGAFAQSGMRLWLTVMRISLYGAQCAMIIIIVVIISTMGLLIFAAP